MKNFNISRQSPSSPQAWKKEYIQKLQQEVNSLYYYLHYYNPSWKLVTDSQGYIGYSPYGSKDIYKDNLLNTTKNYMDVSNIRWYSEFMDVSLITDKYEGSGYITYVLDYETGQVDPQDLTEDEVFTSIYLQAGSYWVYDDNSPYYDYADYIQRGIDIGAPIACLWIDENTRYSFGENHQQITIPQNGTYYVTISFPNQTTEMYNDELWLCITKEDAGWIAYGTPVAPTSSGIYRQALGFRWGIKNNTAEPQYINYGDYGTYKVLNPGATLFKIDASDNYDWIHYMIFEGALAQYLIQTYSFNYNPSTSQMDVVVTNALINAATKGLSYSTQFSKVPPRYYYKNLSLVPLSYVNNAAIANIIYDNNNRITNDGQTIIQEWAENSDICIDAVTSYTVNGQTRYEPLFADVILATENESTQQFKTYLDKTQDKKKPPEDNFKIIVY